MDVAAALTRRLTVGVLALLALTSGPSARSQANVGALAGQVVDDAGRSLAGATVTITLIAKSDKLERTTVTNDAGRFEIRDVPPGRFTVVASLADYHSAEFGAASPFEPGVPVRVVAAQRLSNLVITLRKSAAISGRVTDERGEPRPGKVRAIPTEWRSNSETVETGSDGTYRFANLPPGEYRLIAEPRDKELLVKDKSGVDRTVVPARTFYPAASSEAGAAPVTVGPGDEATGTDIRVSLLPATSVEVTVTTAGGGRPQQTEVALLAADGTLAGAQSYTSGSELPRIDNVVAGRYQLVVSGTETPQGIREERWAAGLITVDGIRPVNVPIVLGSGARIEGRLQVAPTASPEGPSGRVPPLWDAFMGQSGGVRIVALIADDSGRVSTPRTQLIPVWLKPITTSAPRGVIYTDGKFEIHTADPTQFGVREIFPGPYVIQAGDVNAPPGWALKSATIGGRDVLDLPVTLHAGDNITDVALTLTDRFATLRGAVTDADDKPRFDVTVVVFPSDARYWWRGTRRIKTTRPDTSNAYEINDLPAGDYLIATVPQRSQADWNDPDVLRRLAITSTPVTIANADQQMQNLRIR